MITDRNGKPLAISVPAEAVWIDPPEFAPTVIQLQKLSQLLDLKSSTITKIDLLERKQQFWSELRLHVQHVLSLHSL